MSYSKNNPNKKRKMWVKAQKNDFDLRNKDSKVNKLSFTKTLLNVIQTLFDSGYKKFESEKIQNMNDTVIKFDNGTIDFDMRTTQEY